MKKLVKIISIILALTAISGVLASCGDSETGYGITEHTEQTEEHELESENFFDTYLFEDDNEETESEDLFEETEPEEEPEPALTGPRYESRELENIRDLTSFGGSIKKVYTLLGSRFVQYMVEANDGKYYYNNQDGPILEGCDVKKFIFLPASGYGYEDSDGITHLFCNDDTEYLCYGLKGEIFHFYHSMWGDLVVFTIDEGHLYESVFENTGVPDPDYDLNRPMHIYYTEYEDDSIFSRGTDHNYYDFSKVTVYEINGSSYIIAKATDGTLIKASFTGIYDAPAVDECNWTGYLLEGLTEDDIFGIRNNVYGECVYSKKDCDDKLFYMYSKNEFFIKVPEGHTVSEIEYFLYINSIVMVFDNGDVYTGEANTNILGETLTKNETLSSYGKDGHIVQVFDDSFKVVFLMDDGYLYSIHK